MYSGSSPCPIPDPGHRLRAAPQGPRAGRRTWADAGDAELLIGCRSGDGAAWDALVDRYQRLPFSIALRHGLDAEDAADVTQATFVALIDSLATLRDDERLASWIMTVARRTAWRVRRRRQQEAELVTTAVLMTDDIQDWERVVVVHSALARLGSVCRDLLVALYFDPAAPSYAEIARRLGRAVGGIGPLRARCLERLRPLVGEEDRA